MGREDKGKVVGVNEVSRAEQWERVFLFLE